MFRSRPLVFSHEEHDATNPTALRATAAEIWTKSGGFLHNYDYLRKTVVAPTDGRTHQHRLLQRIPLIALNILVYNIARFDPGNGHRGTFPFPSYLLLKTKIRNNTDGWTDTPTKTTPSDSQFNPANFGTQYV